MNKRQKKLEAVCRIQPAAPMGGMNTSPGMHKDDIRSEVRRALQAYAPNGGFVPSTTYGIDDAVYPGIDATITSETDAYNTIYYH